MAPEVDVMWSSPLCHGWPSPKVGHACHGWAAGILAAEAISCPWIGATTCDHSPGVDVINGKCDPWRIEPYVTADDDLRFDPAVIAAPVMGDLLFVSPYDEVMAQRWKPKILL
jgi:hypothetical protein